MDSPLDRSRFVVLGRSGRVKIMAPLGQSWVSHGDSQDHGRWRRSQAQDSLRPMPPCLCPPFRGAKYSASPPACPGPSLNACCMLMLVVDVFWIAKGSKYQRPKGKKGLGKKVIRQSTSPPPASLPSSLLGILRLVTIVTGQRVVTLLEYHDGVLDETSRSAQCKGRDATSENCFRNGFMLHHEDKATNEPC
ncbi:hypothetical protein J3459_010329 [Metarhizium acridum]|nr:hypothetical protein J3459_010329 [Metarhizium acridum]